jgi:hypothetical protein
MPPPRRLPGGLLRVRAERHHALYRGAALIRGDALFSTYCMHGRTLQNREQTMATDFLGQVKARLAVVHPGDLSQSFGLASVAKLHKNICLTPLQLLQHDKTFRPRSGSTACSVGVPPLLLLAVGKSRSK